MEGRLLAAVPEVHDAVRLRAKADAGAERERAVRVDAAVLTVLVDVGAAEPAIAADHAGFEEVVGRTGLRRKHQDRREGARAGKPPEDPPPRHRESFTHALALPQEGLPRLPPCAVGAPRSVRRRRARRAAPAPEVVGEASAASTS